VRIGVTAYVERRVDRASGRVQVADADVVQGRTVEGGGLAVLGSP
jgi:hypothetical protein